MAKKELSEKDIKRRDMILTGNMWIVVLIIASPLAFYQLINQFFKLFDSMIASQISPMSVSAVSYLSQVSSVITALAMGISIGACIKISEAYGAGEFELVHQRVNEMFKMCLLIGLCVAISIPFSPFVLKIMGAPNDFIVEGSAYFAVILFDMIIVTFNSAYIALERVRGNAGRILKLNIIAVFLKLGFNLLFVMVLNFGVTMMAVATVLSDLVIFVTFLKTLCFNKDSNIFSISTFNLKFKKDISAPLMRISLPVMFEKITFQIGKVMVATMASGYGSLVVGALGVSNNIGGMTITFQGGFKDAGASIISQNVGAGNKRRALDAFYKICIISVIIGVVGVFLAVKYLPFIASFFDGGDPEFSILIQEIYLWEAWGAIPQGIFSATIGLLYGFGYTKITFALNFARIFVLRVPVLWYMQNFTNIGSISVGIVMLISNGGISFVSIFVAIAVIIKLKREIAIEEAQEKLGISE